MFGNQFDGSCIDVSQAALVNRVYWSNTVMGIDVVVDKIEEGEYYDMRCGYYTAIFDPIQ